NSRNPPLRNTGGKEGIAIQKVFKYAWYEARYTLNKLTLDNLSGRLEKKTTLRGSGNVAKNEFLNTLDEETEDRIRASFEENQFPKAHLYPWDKSTKKEKHKKLYDRDDPSAFTRSRNMTNEED